MGKLIYITESQLNEIIGINPADSTNLYRYGGLEITSDGTTGSHEDGNQKYGKPTTSDEIEKSLSRKQWGVGGFPPVRRGVVRESNQDFTGSNNTMQISNTIIDDLKSRLSNYNGNRNDPGVKRSEEIIRKGRVSYDNAYRILDDYKNGKSGDILTPELEKEIRRKLDTAENISKDGRVSKQERGLNVLKSAPKDGTKGGAHTLKGNNTIGVTYFN